MNALDIFGIFRYNKNYLSFKEELFMATCEKCGKEIMEDETICAECAAAQTAPQFHPDFTAVRPEPAQSARQQAFHIPLTRKQLPAEYRPLSAWGYFGYQILFAIPLIGFIFLLVFALGGTRNVNLRSFARSYFCALLIALILIAIAVVVVIALDLQIPNIQDLLNLAA